MQQLELMLAPDVKGLAAGGQHRESRAGRDEGGNLRGGAQHLLKVIEDEQVPLPSQDAGERVLESLAGLFTHPKCVGDGGDDKVGVPHGGQVDEGGTILERQLQPHPGLEGQASLSAPSHAGHGHQTPFTVPEE